jgi:hypothetical protein
MPIITNLRLDLFERTGMGSSMGYYNWFAYQFWRFVFVQEAAEKFAELCRVPALAGTGELQPGFIKRTVEESSRASRCINNPIYHRRRPRNHPSLGRSLSYSYNGPLGSLLDRTSGW